jgi:hypothetical protein
MTIMDALFRTDALKPNSYANPEKIRWLSILDGIIKEQIIDTHEDGDDKGFNGYEEDVELTTELLVPPPFDEIYIYWLMMQIDHTNGEYKKYNNSMQVYNTAYTAFANHYNRTHMPKGSKFKFF